MPRLVVLRKEWNRTPPRRMVPRQYNLSALGLQGRFGVIADRLPAMLLAEEGGGKELTAQRRFTFSRNEAVRW